MTSQSPLTVDPAARVAGVDTHTDTHTLAILTAQGQVVHTETFRADDQGYQALIVALRQAEEVQSIGVEGTNSYGAALTRALTDAGYVVQEVLRPTRQVRRMDGKSDAIDAVEAARALLAGHHVSEAKDTTTAAEALRFLLTARTQLIKSATALSNTVLSLLVTAPDTVRSIYRGLKTPVLMQRLATSQSGNDLGGIAVTAVETLRQLARAYQQAKAQAEVFEEQMHQILAKHYPNLLGIYGVGTIVAAKLAVTAGGNPQRIRNEAAFAALCGAAPIPASSGRTTRHRLNRGGDRRGNSALHDIALVRMRHDPTTKAYVDRRTAEGKSNKEILRCLKRAIVREVYRALATEQVLPNVTDLRAIRHRKSITQTQVAQALNTHPSRISDIERNKRPLPELTKRYEKWLRAA